MKTVITERAWYKAGKAHAEKVISEYGAVTKVVETHIQVTNEKRPSVWHRYWVHFEGGKHTGVFEATVSRARDKNAEKGGYWLTIKRVIEVYQTGKK